MRLDRISKIRSIINKGDRCLLRYGLNSSSQLQLLPKPEIGVIVDIFEHHIIVRRRAYHESFSYIDIVIGDSITLI